MKRQHNSADLKDKRRRLRRDQTEVEKLVWAKLRNKQLHDLKFFRQYSMGKYILDFYCPERKLAIEMDGGQHAQIDHVTHDNQRAIYLNSEGVQVLRIWNNDARNNLSGVLERIRELITPPTPLILRGGTAPKNLL